MYVYANTLIQQEAWRAEQTRKAQMFARFCSLVDNDTDRWLARGLGVTLGPRAIEHSKNVPREDDNG